MKKALDLCCCDGGATRGLQLAGFHVTGVDIEPHPRYCGDDFIQGNALTVDLFGYDFIWASPPCQKFSRLRHLHQKSRPNLIPKIRGRLIANGTPWCIENVEEAPLGATGNLIMLCGTMFDLRTRDGRAELRRHRIFETSFSIPLRPACQHSRISALSVCGKGGHFAAPRVLTVVGHTPVDNIRRATLTITGTGLDDNRMRAVRQTINVHGTGSPLGSDYNRHRKTISITGSTPQANVERNIVREVFTVEQAREAMGIDWMSMKGLSQAVPPAYSRFIAEQFLSQL